MHPKIEQYVQSLAGFFLVNFPISGDIYLPVQDYICASPYRTMCVVSYRAFPYKYPHIRQNTYLRMGLYMCFPIQNNMGSLLQGFPLSIFPYQVIYISPYRTIYMHPQIEQHVQSRTGLSLFNIPISGDIGIPVQDYISAPPYRSICVVPYRAFPYKCQHIRRYMCPVIGLYICIPIQNNM